MNKSTKSVSALLALSLTGMLLVVGQARDRGQGPRPASPPTSVQARHLGGRAGVRRMSAEEKLIRNAYVKLMRYQSAGVDELAAISNKESGPDDYLRFELRDIHTGSIEEITSRPLADIVTPPGGDTVRLKGHHLTWGSGPAHAYYEATWRTEINREQAQERKERQTAAQVRSGKDLFVGVERYTSYQVTVMLGGKQRVYRAMAMHEGNRETGVEKSEIVDNITSDMNLLLAEESPRVRSPWKTYIKSGLYLAVVREIGDKIKAGLPLIAPDASVGYLPGDHALPYDKGAEFGIAVVCVDPEVSIESFLGVGKGQTVNVPVTVTPTGTQITLTLTTTSGTAAKFAANNSTTLIVTQSGSVAIMGETESSTANNIRLEAKQGSTSVDSDDFSVVLVTLSFKTLASESLSNDNEARAKVIQCAGTANLGTFFSNGLCTKQWTTAAEIIGTVIPSNYAGSVRLEREIIEKRRYDNKTLLSPVDKNVPDTSPSDFRDDDPQSGLSNGKVYDADGPGFMNNASVPMNGIRRRRQNFRQWATIDGVRADDPRIRASVDFNWFHRLSIIKTVNGDELYTNVTGDNIAGEGTTKLTWDLK